MRYSAKTRDRDIMLLNFTRTILEPMGQVQIYAKREILISSSQKSDIALMKITWCINHIKCTDFVYQVADNHDSPRKAAFPGIHLATRWEEWEGIKTSAR